MSAAFSNLRRTIALSNRTLKNHCKRYGVQFRVQPLSAPSLEFSHVSNFRPFTTFKRHFKTSAMASKEIVPFKLSDIGEGIKEVSIKEWFVKEGDTVAQFDQICEVQSDKASVTITSRYDGVVRKLHYAVDDTALVGSALVDIEVTESSIPAEQVEEVQEGDAIQVGVASAQDSFHLPSFGASKAIATPAVRRIAAEYKIDLKTVQGTGRDGRVLKEDVLNFLNAKTPAAAATAVRGTPASGSAEHVTTKSQQQESPSTTVASALPKRSIVSAGDRTEAIKGYMKTMIRTMTEANQIPHFGYSDEINVTQMLQLRKQLKDSVAQQYNVKLTTLSLFLKSASLALSQFPILNATLDLQANTVIYKGAHNIGVAMDTKQGLIVPNIKNVESKCILEIADDLDRLQRGAMSGQVRPDDLRGGTFSISNIGSIGGTYAHPVILPPEVAIVAIGRVQTRPRFSETGTIVRTEVVNVSFSCDHRIIDGATAARFSNLWKQYIEDPARMLIHLK